MGRSQRQKKSQHVGRALAKTSEEIASEKLNESEKVKPTRYYFFWQKGSPFSQWHPCRYELNNVAYCCAEQGMMHGKAELFKDHEAAEKILSTNDPGLMKSLGRAVRSFDDKKWRQNRERIVYENSLAKFTQNPHLLESLMNTEGLLVEASPYDRIWGIGLSEAKARNLPDEKWRGLNLLGKILTQVRDEIKSGMHDELIAASVDQASEI